MTITMDLSPREKEVINVIVKEHCLTREMISKRLNITVRTVSLHLNNIYLKKNYITNSIAAIVWDYYNRGNK